MCMTLVGGTTAPQKWAGEDKSRPGGLWAVGMGESLEFGGQVDHRSWISMSPFLALCPRLRGSKFDGAPKGWKGVPGQHG